MYQFPLSVYSLPDGNNARYVSFKIILQTIGKRDEGENLAKL